MQSRYSTTLVLTGLFFAGAVNSEQSLANTDQGKQDSKNHQQNQEHLIVTGVQAPEPTSYTSASMEILSREDIQLTNKTSTTDLLRRQSGLLVNQQGGMGGVSEISIRGSESNFVTVLVDGIAVNDPTNSRGGSVNLNAFNLANIDHIEIVRGPQSSIYGSGSLGGVIHILTHNPSLQPQTLQQRFQMDTAEQGAYRLSYQLSGGIDQLNYALSLGQQDSGDDLDDSYTNDEFSGHLRWQLDQRHGVSLNLRHSNDQRLGYPEQSGGSRLSDSEALEQNDGTEWNTRLAWSSIWSETWQSELSVTHFERQNRSRSPGIIPYTSVPPLEDDTSYRRTETRWTHTLGQRGRLWAHLGVDYQKERGHSTGSIDFGFPLPTNFELERENLGLFATANWVTNNDWLLQLSHRYDEPDSSRRQHSSQVGFKSPQLWNHFVVRGNWGEAFKLPSFFALAHPLVGNPDLLPEEADGWDLALDWNVSRDAQLTLAVFSSEYKDLVDFDPEQFTNVNRTLVDIKGAELSGQWAHSYGSLKGHMSYTDIDVKDNQSELSGRPQLTASLQSRHPLSESLQLVLDWFWSDERYATSWHGGVFSDDNLDSYNRLDVSFIWDFSHQWQASLTLDNILDEDYEEAIGFESPDRQLRLGLSVDF